jgi:hypothetical protein
VESSHKVEDRAGGVDDGVRAPVLGLVGAVEIAPGGGERGHAGGGGGFDVACGVADVQTLRRAGLAQFGGDQHRGRVGLGLGAGVAGDDAACALGQIEDRHQRFGKTRGFVGDDTPGQISGFKCGKQIQYAGKGLGVTADIFAVQLQEFFAHECEMRVVWVQVETHPEQATRAVRGLRADDGVGQRGQAVAAALQVERVAQIGCGVDECAVEIEQHGADAF